jgi:hypothetical protein
MRPHEAAAKMLCFSYILPVWRRPASPHSSKVDYSSGLSKNIDDVENIVRGRILTLIKGNTTTPCICLSCRCGMAGHLYVGSLAQTSTKSCNCSSSSQKKSKFKEQPSPAPVQLGQSQASKPPAVHRAERSVGPGRPCLVHYREERILARCTQGEAVHTCRPSGTPVRDCIRIRKDLRGLAVLDRRRIGLRIGGVVGRMRLFGGG